LSKESQDFEVIINGYQKEASEASEAIARLTEENAGLTSQLAEKEDRIRTLEARLNVQETAHARALETLRAELVLTQAERDEAGIPNLEKRSIFRIYQN
jgi:predicted RNase H-like nuclease (RuvC/YqgF family)